MEYVLAATAGFIAFTLVPWAAEILTSRGDPEVILASDERTALQRTEEIVRLFADNALPEMGRLEMLRRVNWIWRSARLIALRSGRWSAIPWLALGALCCLALSVKTLIVPDSHDLRLLLGGREFLDYFTLVKRRS